MTRDWLLNLLAPSPFLFAATIVVLALIRNPVQNERDSPAPQASARRE